MSSRNKLYKFSQMLEFSNVVQNFDSSTDELIGQGHTPVQRKGVWAKEQFGNENPIALELACGRGEYTVALAKMYPDINFIGVDVKGARLWQGARRLQEEGLDNGAFLRCRIEMLSKFFAMDEIDEIWITFPDPFLKQRKSSRRLTAAGFLDEYKRVLRPGGIIHLKTDELRLYDFTREVLATYPSRTLFSSADLYTTPDLDPRWSLTTHYEQLHIADGDQICGISFQLLAD